MKKKVFGKKFSRSTSTRNALARSLVRAFMLSGSITTTVTKARFLREHVERLVNIAKTQSIAKRRQILSILGNDQKTADFIFTKAAPKFVNRQGGYTRTIKLPNRKGDAAPMARIEWVEKVEVQIARLSDKSKKNKSKTDTATVTKKTGLVAKLKMKSEELRAGMTKK